MKLAVIIILFVIIALAAATAQVVNAPAQSGIPIPIYDVNGRCTSYFTARGFTAEDMKGLLLAASLNECVEEEQEWYDDLKSVWYSVPEATRQDCVAKYLTGMNPYQAIFQACIKVWLLTHPTTYQFQP
jgi:hypothetical protein